jgi:hypothetical protein
MGNKNYNEESEEALEMSIGIIKDIFDRFEEKSNLVCYGSLVNAVHFILDKFEMTINYEEKVDKFSECVKEMQKPIRGVRNEE